MTIAARTGFIEAQPAARYRAVATGLGTFAVIEHVGGAVTSRWIDADDDRALLAEAREDRRWQPALFALLRDYFAGRAANFDVIPTPAGPEFFRRCWDACRRITPGTTISYGALAQRAGSPTASRAAGQAMRRNPLPVIVPCHRVVSASGSLHGFAGSTDPDAAPLRRKKRLLELELSD